MNEEDRATFGNYLRSLREARGLTQREAAAMAEISNPYITQLEKGQRNPPSRDILTRLARVYHTSESKVLEAAGYIEQNRPAVTPERIEWAFETARRDPQFTYGTRMEGHELTLAAKAFIVECYQESTGRHLLTEPELAATKEL